jgi:hypothetical protein
MADTASGAQAAISGDNCSHQFVGMQAALHQEFCFGVTQQLHCFSRGCVAVWNINDLNLADVNTCRIGN